MNKIIFLLIKTPLLRGVGGVFLPSFNAIMCCVLVIAGNNLQAQQDPMYTNYMFNTLAVNPAYAGSRDALSATLLSRNQWVGFDGAPSTQTLTIHSPLGSEKLGVGFSAVRDKIGPVNTNSFYGDFSYRVKMSDESHLSLGLKAGINTLSANLSTLKTDQSGDVSFQQNIEGKTLPNVGFGMYYYSPKYYVGLSAPKLLENTFSSNTQASEKRHYYLIAGAVFKVSEDIKFKPTLLTKYAANAPIQVDVSANFLFIEKLWAGVMYRSNDGIGALVGYQITDQFRVGYAYDYPTSVINRYSSASHEIMISYDFIFNNTAHIKSPRYF